MRRLVSSTQVMFFYLNHNDLLTRGFSPTFYLTLFLYPNKTLVACNFNSTDDLT